MDSRRLRSTRGSTPSFIKPLLNTLNSMRGRESTTPDQVNSLAEQLMWSEFGTEAGAPETSHAHASVDLVADHTRYVDGFGLHIPMDAGVSVSVRLSDAPAPRVCGLDGEEHQALVVSAMQSLVPGLPEGKSVEAAVVSNVSPGIVQSVEAPLIVAIVRAMSALFSAVEPVAKQARSVWKGRSDDHRSLSRLLASASVGVPAFILTDVRLFESIAVEVPQIERPGLALVWHEEGSTVPDTRMHHDQVARAVETLKAGSFPALESLRDIVHRDLDRALSELPRKLRPIVTHLVTENGRVQKLVAAIQRRDWQMFGALLLMSHSSKVSDFKLGHPESEFVVKQIENMILDGMYGATLLTGDSELILIAGQPFSVPPALERLLASFKDRFGHSLSTQLL